MYNKDELAAIVRECSLKIAPEGEYFTLASGKKSKYYCDGKMTTLDARGAVLIGEGILELIQQDATFPDAVAGSRGIDLKAFLVRKETKDHGTQKYIEGPVKAGNRVIVVEDVVTTGGSSLKAIERLEEAGIKVDGVVAILDRMEGGAQAFVDRGYSFRSLLKITDFGIDPPQA